MAVDGAAMRAGTIQRTTGAQGGVGFWADLFLAEIGRVRIRVVAAPSFANWFQGEGMRERTEGQTHIFVPKRRRIELGPRRQGVVPTVPVILVSGNLKSDEGLDYRTRFRVERPSFDRRCKNQLRYPNPRVLGKVRFPKDTLDNWDRSHDTECQQRPSSTSSLILIKPAGDEETNASAKGNTSASDQHDLRKCKTFRSHIRSCKFMCKTVAIAGTNSPVLVSNHTSGGST